MRAFPIVCLTPPALADPSIAIAAGRAGGVGILDLELVRDEEAAAAALATLARLGRGDLGARLDGGRGEFLTRIVSGLPAAIRTVVLTGAAPDDLRRHVALLRARNLRVVLEATAIEEAVLGEEMGVDAIIAKGHEAAGRVGEETTFILLQRLLARGRVPVWAQGG